MHSVPIALGSHEHVEGQGRHGGLGDGQRRAGLSAACLDCDSCRQSDSCHSIVVHLVLGNLAASCGRPCREGDVFSRLAQDHVESFQTRWSVCSRELRVLGKDKVLSSWSTIQNECIVILCNGSTSDLDS